MTDEVVLVCPQGAEQALISDGTVGYEAFRSHKAGKWLVVVPEEVARRLCWNTGFYRHSDQTIRPQ